ncbi:MAG: hypothetical protein QF790_05480 [Gammaproteobacteria bacterium]|jgi:hypothetical protein|nr:hypothetical protein [Gammaproteobacteria bacterium]
MLQGIDNKNNNKEHLMRHLSDRFIAAVRLCTGSGPVKQRLTDAWLTQLDEIEPGELPTHLRAEFASLRQAMYRYKPMPQETGPQASIRKMSASQATRYKALIVRMLGEILRIKYAIQKRGPDTTKNSKLDTEIETSLEADHLLN